MMDPTFQVPVLETGHFATLGNGDRTVLMPSQRPVVRWRLVEQDRPYGHRVLANYRSDKLPNGPILEEPAQGAEVPNPLAGTPGPDAVGEFCKSAKIAGVQYRMDPDCADFLKLTEVGNA